MKVFVEGGQLFDGEETPAEEEIGKLEKVRQEGDKPAEPGEGREGPAILEEKENDQNRGGEIGQKFLKKSGPAAFDLLG